jgi:hypothetical protein
MRSPRRRALVVASPSARWIGPSSSLSAPRFDEEIDKEIRIKKFTADEFDEEERNLERLRRWYRELCLRDAFGAASRPEAERRVKECTDRLEDRCGDDLRRKPSSTPSSSRRCDRRDERIPQLLSCTLVVRRAVLWLCPVSPVGGVTPQASRW